MLPEIPRELAIHPGPVASVYLEVSRDRGAAPHEVRLRWEALAAELRGQGAEVLEQFAQELRLPPRDNHTKSHMEASMQRGSDKHGARKDDALARDVENMMRGTGPTHAEEWKDPEPPADDDPQLNTRMAAENRGEPR